MATRKAEKGDWVRMLLPVVEDWDDDTITVEINGQRVTMKAENRDIEEVVKGEKPRRRQLFDKPD